MSKNPYYNQGYTKEQISSVLKIIKQCIKTGDFYISLGKNREENQSFLNDYHISVEKQKTILLHLRVDDFCYTLKNTKTGYEHEILYVFAPQVELYDVLDEKETVTIYTKFNVLELPNGNRVIVISFHKLNRNIDYAFR